MGGSMEAEIFTVTVFNRLEIEASKPSFKEI